MNAFVAPWQNVTPQDFLGAAETGAQLGLSARHETEEERAARARESLESARLNQEAAAAAAKTKAEAEQQAYARAQEAQKGALEIFKVQQPDVITPRGGGIYTRDPVTGQMTQAGAPTATPVKAPAQKTPKVIQVPIDPANPQKGNNYFQQDLKTDPSGQTWIPVQLPTGGGPTELPDPSALYTAQPGGMGETLPLPGSAGAPAAPRIYMGPNVANPLDSPAAAPTIGAPPPSPLNAPAAAKTATPADKVALANQIATEHPDWTKQRVIDAVNQQ